MKECRQCKQTKELSAYSKCTSNKDGLQYKCRECNKKDNYNFRTEKPEHHEIWQSNHRPRVKELIKKYRRADKGGLIYLIRNPIGELYIGASEMYLKVRKLYHITHYKRALAGKRQRLPLLHNSFDTWGVKNHTFEEVVHFEDIDRKQLEMIESSFIQSVKLTGKSLNYKIK